MRFENTWLGTKTRILFRKDHIAAGGAQMVCLVKRVSSVVLKFQDRS